jgi:hypothetical protein
MGSLNFLEKTLTEDKYFLLSDYDEYINDRLSISKAQRVATAWHLMELNIPKSQGVHNFLMI